jgi:hypothetical protein
MLSRREFVVLTAAATLAPRSIFAAEKVPTMLDHLLLGCSDLDQGIAFVEKQTGVRADIGGVHPGRGTRNALLGLGPLHYLEIIAPDSAQSVYSGLPGRLQRLSAPTLVAWAVHTTNIAEFSDRWWSAGQAFQGPSAGSRVRPDGKLLQWQTLNLDDDRGGLLPFVIQWATGTTHPSEDSARGCVLESFAAVTPESGVMLAEFQKLGIPVQVEQGAPAHLRARIVGPKGSMVLG